MFTITTSVREQQSTITNYGVAIAIAMVAVVLPILAISIYGYATLTASKPSRTSSVEINNDTGVVAVLGANNQFLNDEIPITNQSAAAQATTPATTKEEQLTYSFNLPAEWIASEPQPCSGNTDAQSTTYTNQSRTVVIYENTRPTDCGGEQAADTYLDYDFSDDSASITVKTSVITQCNKQDEPACPKGDGKVSVFIGNESPTDKATDVANTLTKKTYFLSMTDTIVSGTFASQVTELSSLSKLFKIQ